MGVIVFRLAGNLILFGAEWLLHRLLLGCLWLTLKLWRAGR